MDFKFDFMKKDIIHIVCSAIKVEIKTHRKKIWIQFYGKRHSDILKKINEKGFTPEYKINHIDGFMYAIDGDNQWLFISREEATKIAKKIIFL